MDPLRLLDANPGTPGDPAVVDEVLHGAGLGRRGPRIRCPRCAWRPRRQDRWICSHLGCGMIWNTFETGGRCPRCHHQWMVTVCLACDRLSRHLDWYEPGAEPGRLG